MYKKNKVVITFLVFLFVLTLGYALLSERVTINGIATAKGNFDVVLKCKNTENMGNATGTCSVNDNTVSTASILTKPEEEIAFYVDVTNNGTIPVKITGVTSPNNVTHDFYSSGDCYFVDFNYYLQGYYFLGSGMCDSDFEGTDYVLESGETIDLIIGHAWLDSTVMYLGSGGVLSSNQPVIPKGYVFDYDVTINFAQATN